MNRKINLIILLILGVLVSLIGLSQVAYAETETLYVDGCTTARAEWDNMTTTPYLDNNDASLIHEIKDASKEAGDFSFANTATDGTNTINSVTLYFECQADDAPNNDGFVVYIDSGDGNGFTNVGTVKPSTAGSYAWDTLVVSAKLNTWTKIDAATMYLDTVNTGGGDDRYVRRAYLYVDHIPDVIAPTLDSAARTDDTHITVTLSELAVEATITKAHDGGFTVAETGDPTTTYTVSAIAPLVAGNDDEVVLTVADMGISAKEGVTVTYTEGVNGTVTDVADNPLATDTTGVAVTAWDIEAPTITSGTVSSGNVYFDVLFSEGVYGADDGSTALTAAQLALTFVQGAGTATNTTIFSIKQDDAETEAAASPLTGGEITIRVFLTVTGTPNGVETIEIKPTDATSVYDKAGNAALATQTTGAQTLKDQAAPEVSPPFVPADEETGVATIANLEITFNETVVKGTGDIVIKYDTSTFETIDVTSATKVSIAANVVTINPDLTFEALTGYYVQIAATCFDDSVGNSYAGIPSDDTDTWNFTTESVVNQRPSVTIEQVDNDPSYSGKWFGNKDIEIDYTLTDAENDACDIDIEYSVDSTDGDNGSWTDCTDAGGASEGKTGLAASSGGTAHVFLWDADGQLPTTEDSIIWVRITPSDAGGAGTTVPSSSFGLDNVAPTASAPTSDAQTLKGGTESTSTVQSNEAGNIYLVNVSVTDVTTQAEIDAAVAANNAWLGKESAGADTAYTVTPLAALNDGVYDIVAVDAVGNVSASLSGWLTVDNTAPTNQDTVFASSVSKQGGASVTIVSSGDATNNVWFAPSGTTSFTANGTMTTAGGTATTILAPATEGAYRMFVIDAVGNYSTQSTAILTVDNTAPQVSPPFVPADEATGVAVGANLEITFNENVVKGTGDIVIKYDTTTFETIDVTSATKVSIAANVVTIDPAGIFAISTSYYVQIAATCFTDAAGNPYAGITDTDTWNFTTTDNTAPVLGYSSDNTLGTATQKTDGSGEVDILFRVKDANGASDTSTFLSGSAQYNVAEAGWTAVADGSVSFSPSSTFAPATDWSGTEYTLTWASKDQIPTTDSTQVQFRFKVNDGEADSADGTTSTFTVDNVAPTCTVTGITESSDYLYEEGGDSVTKCFYGDDMSTTQTVTIAGTTSDTNLSSTTGSNVFGDAQTNGGTAASWTFAIAIDNTDAASYADETFTITATDSYGNTGPDSVTLDDDVTNPVCTVTGITESSDYLYEEGGDSVTKCFYGDDMSTTQTVTIAGTGTDTGGSGVASSTGSTVFGDAQTNGGTAASWTFDIAIDNTDAASYADETFTITTTDNVGNTHADSVTLDDDVTAPTNVGCSTPADGAQEQATGIVLKALTATDAGAGLTSTPYYFQLDTVATFNSGNLQNSGWIADGDTDGWDPTLSASITYYWRVKAKDNVGNESAQCGHTANTEGYGTFTTALDWTQTDWEGGSGQSAWTDETRYSAESNIYDTTTGETKLTSSLAPGIVDHVVISEVFQNASGDDTNCFIELYNPTSEDIDITGWYILEYQQDSPGVPLVDPQWGSVGNPPDPFSGTIPAYGYWLIGEQATLGDEGWGYTIVSDTELSAAGDIIENGSDDGLVLYDSSDNYVDGCFAWVTVGTTSFVDETALSIPIAGKSQERKSDASGVTADQGNGYDTDDNSNDFVQRTTPEPQNSSSSTEAPPSTYSTPGTLTSSIYDAGAAGADWDIITWTADETPAGTSVTVKVRTSDDSGMSGATAWASCDAATSGNDISSLTGVTDAHRYIQYYLTLGTTDTSNTPTFEIITIKYAVSAGDTTDPTVTIASTDPTTITTGGTSTVTWSANEAGDYTVRVGGDGSDPASGTQITGANASGSYTSGDIASVVNAADLSEGSNTIYVYVTDAASNTGSDSTAITLDTTAPVISNVTILNVTMKVGSEVTATITVSSDTDSYTLTSGTIGGFTLGSLSKTNDTTYTAIFTITDGGTDVAAGSDIPISNLVLTDTATNPSTAYETPISQGSDLIDANLPNITAVTITNAAMNVGDVVTAIITIDDDGSATGTTLTLGTIGGFTLGGLSVTNNTTLTATFTITDGGTDVAAGSDIPVANLVVADAATNPSNTWTTAISQGSDPIDANRPNITNVTIPNVAMKVDSEVTATITIDDDGSAAGTTLTSGTIGGFSLGSLSVTDNTTLTATFTITDGGTDVAAGSDIPIADLIVADAADNLSNTWTTAISQGSDLIDANLPNITAVSILDEAMKVDDVVTATITIDDDGSAVGTTLTSGTIGGFSLGGLSVTNNTTLTATFTITDGGTDVAAGSDIPIADLIVADAADNPSNTWTTAISQGSDPIDANLPVVSTYDPTVGATNVTINADLVLTFSENVVDDTGDIVIKKSSDDSTFETIAVGNANVTIVGDVVTIDPDNTFEKQTGYYVQIAATCFDDDPAGNSYAGIASDDTTTWNFTTTVVAGDVVINELMWMGDSTATVGADCEWVELRNTTASAIDISGWELSKLVDGTTEYICCTIPASSTISANGYFLIADFDKDNSSINVTPDYVVGAGDGNDGEFALVNTKLQIKLYDGDWDGTPTPNVIDTADDGPTDLDAPHAGDIGNRYSMERAATPGDGTLAENWATASTQNGWDAGATEKGTPRRENGSSETTETVISITNWRELY